MTHRLLGQYAEALADLTRSVELDPDDPWTHYETAVVMSVLRHRDRDGHLTRAVELSPPEGGARSADETSTLVLVHRLRPRWERAEQHLGEFLDAVPSPLEVRELIFSLRSLISVVPSSEARIEGFCRLLEERLAAVLPSRPPHAPTS